ncbi:hypothetical protein CXB51_021153 [Gossypium anomalum]|uniref:Uncharacterized protein n=1 Tax=Gossypium anomalum TaxID=47600 RepID=A0A8J5YS03_9ROSI|nr:hypothetical protein CXB51_021153 [Gossypium anomalum]
MAHCNGREKGRSLSVPRSLSRPLAEPPGVQWPSNQRENAGAHPSSELERGARRMGGQWLAREEVRRRMWRPRLREQAAAEAWKG